MSRRRKDNAQRELGDVGKAYQNSQHNHSITVERPLQFLSIAIWRMAYSLEESRQRHQSAGNHFRLAACIVGQVALRMLGGAV